MKLKIFSIVALAALLVGCNNKYLNQAENSNGPIAPELIGSSETGVTNALTGIAWMLRQYDANNGGGQNHISRGLKAHQLGAEYMANDVIANPSQWWTFEANYDLNVFNATGYRALSQWRMFYAIINNCNNLIGAVEASTELSPDFKKVSIAEARAIRGICYFYLVRTYSKPIPEIGGPANLANALGVPVYTEPTVVETPGKPRGTMADTYKQIDADLAVAIADLPAGRTASNKFRVCKDVAMSWRAMTYLERSMWAEAAADAMTVFDSGRYPLMGTSTYRSTGFNTISSSEWIYGFPYNADQQMMYASMYSFLDNQRPQNGYKTFFLNTTFKALFSATDCRNMFIKPNNGNTTWGQWTSTKFTDRQPAADGDYVIMRSAEMLLIGAECAARQGNDGDAADLLYSLQVARDPAAVRSGKTGNELIEEILVERRKELYGEVGVQYFDLRRLGRPMVRNGNNPNAPKSVPVGAPQWTSQIPKAELDRNPQIPQTDQNPIWQ